MGKGIHKFAIKKNSGTNRHNWKYSLAQSCCRISGLIMLLIPAYGALHNLLYGYYPYTYSYMPLNLWFILTGLLYGLQAPVLYKQYGLKGLKLSSIFRYTTLSLIIGSYHSPKHFSSSHGKHKNHAWFRDRQTSNQRNE